LTKSQYHRDLEIVVSVHSNHEPNKSLRSLLSKHINTGLGFEHSLFVLQNKLSNYNMDLFTPLSEKIQEVSGARPYQGHFGAQKMDVVDTMYHVVADHMRTSIFANSNDEVPTKSAAATWCVESWEAVLDVAEITSTSRLARSFPKSCPRLAN
jgi:alanyl-tRNA synthetase